MKVATKLLVSTAATVLSCSAVQAQQANPDAATPTAPPSDQDIIVTGIRGSLEGAAGIKRGSAQIVDSIVAEDIGKLPDVNVAEALQRITGIQITRNQGEGSGITIRGLGQIRTELDGRSIFTAASGRTLSLEDIPSELLSGIDVYKSSAADQIEGGISGLINLRLRKPFDAPGLQIAGQARGTYYDLVGKFQPAVSGLVSDRWNTGIGEIGALISVSYQKTAFRNDTDATGNATARTDLVDVNKNGVLGEAADTVFIPAGTNNSYSAGSRERIGVNGSLQWRPAPNLELYADGFYSHYNIKQDYLILSAGLNGQTAQTVGPIALFPGSNNFESGTFANPSLATLALNGDRTSETWQGAGGFKWSQGGARLTGDVSYTKGTSTSPFYLLLFTASPARLVMNQATNPPSFSLPGFDATNVANYAPGGFFSQSNQLNTGKEFAARLDSDFDIDSGFLSGMKFGVRYADRGATRASGSGGAGFSNPLSTIPNFVSNYSLTTFDGYQGSIVSAFVAPSLDLLRNGRDAIRQQLGLPLGDPTPQIQNTYVLSEKSLAAYVMAKIGFAIGGVNISGNAGVRIIRTQVSTNGVVNDPAPATTFSPFAVTSNDTDLLPALNLKADLTDHLVLRFTASKTLTRPDFDNLSPTLNLDFQFRTGSGGNPALRPIRSTGFDTSLEYYFTKSSYAYAAGFYKDVDGFFVNETSNENIPGLGVFSISRTVNGALGKIRGFEVGWNQFLDFLPGLLGGLGFQANYTYVDSEAPSPTNQLSGIPLPGLSKNSYNLIGFYEKGPVSVRVAYNWREKYLNSTSSASDIIADYTAAAGYLDASANVDLTKHFNVFVDGANLLNTPQTTFFTDPQRAHNYSVVDRRLAVGIRAKF